jgi:type II secretion system protein G
MRLGRDPERGYSTIEMMVTLVLTGVLAAIAISATNVALDRARQRATMADMRTISRAIEAYVVDYEKIPEHAGGLQALQEQISGYTNTMIPVRDSWGHEYGFFHGEDKSYTLVSYGKDGIDGEDYVRGAKFDFTRDLVMFNGIFVRAPE